jgi:O-antigen/teichoic acid export membrane protein
MAETNIKNKAISGVAWSLLERFGIQGMKLIFGIMLARLLSPKEFGIIGMVTVFFLIAQVFIDSGFGQAFIQKKEIDEKDANTVFYSNLVISLILYILLYFFAPVIANFYDEPMLKQITRVMGLVIVLNAFSIIQISYLKRKLNFEIKSKVSLISIVISGILGVVAAWRGLGVWSLVIQNMSERFFITLGLWIVSKWKPSFVFSWASFKDMFSFGLWVLLAGLFDTFFENIYALIIGKVFSLGQLGYYSQSKKFQRLSSRQMVGSIAAVSFPVLAEAQSNLPRFRNMLKKFLQQTLMFMTPFLVTFIIVAKPFVIILMKEKWAPMIPYLQLLLIIGILHPIQMVNLKALLALGKSRLNFTLGLIKSVLRIINIVVMYRYGVLYIVLGEVVIAFLSIFINSIYAKRDIQYGLLKQLKDIWKIFFAALVAGGVGILIATYIQSLWLHLILGIVSTLSIYIMIQYLINRDVLLETLSLVKALLLKQRRKFVKR